MKPGDKINTSKGPRTVKRPVMIFPVGSRVRFPGESVLGIVTSSTVKRAKVDWVGFVYAPNYDGWYEHAKLRPFKAT